jgi:hypothetical protein
MFLVLQWKATFGNWCGVFTSVLCTKLYLRNTSVSLIIRPRNSKARKGFTYSPFCLARTFCFSKFRIFQIRITAHNLTAEKQVAAVSLTRALCVNAVTECAEIATVRLWASSECRSVEVVGGHTSQTVHVPLRHFKLLPYLTGVCVCVCVCLCVCVNVMKSHGYPNERHT